MLGGVTAKLRALPRKPPVTSTDPERITPADTFRRRTVRRPELRSRYRRDDVQYAAAMHLMQPQGLRRQSQAGSQGDTIPAHNCWVVAAARTLGGTGQSASIMLDAL